MNQFDSICQALEEIERTNKFILKRLHQQENHFKGDEGQVKSGHFSDTEMGKVLEKMVELEARETERDEQIDKLIEKVAWIGDKLTSFLSDLNVDNSDSEKCPNIPTIGDEKETTENSAPIVSTESHEEEVADCGIVYESRDKKFEKSLNTETDGDYVVGERNRIVTENSSTTVHENNSTNNTQEATSNIHQVHDGRTDTPLMSDFQSDVEKEVNGSSECKSIFQSYKLRRKRTEVTEDNRLSTDADMRVVSLSDTCRETTNIGKIISDSSMEVSPHLHIPTPDDLEEKWKRDRELLAKAVPIDAAEFYRQKATLEACKGRSLSHLRGKGIDTVFVIDTSESMVGEGFRQIRSAFQSIMEEIEETSQSGHEENVAVITFGTETQVLEHLSCKYSKIKHCLDDIECRGPSPLLSGLWTTLGPIHGGAGENVFNGWHIYPRLILMTDGRATCPEYPDGPENPDVYDKASVNMNIMHHVQKMKTKIYCVPVGDPDMDILGAITAISNGQIVHLHEVRTKLGRFQINVDRACKLRFLQNRGWETMSDEKIIQQLLSHTSMDSSQTLMIKDGDGSEIREMLCNQERFKPQDETEDDDQNEYIKIEDPSMPSFGSRVRRGPDWKWREQDSRGPGTVVGHGQPGTSQEKWIYIKWDSVDKPNCYRFGAEGCYDVMVVDEPKVLIDQLIDVGCLVTRGPDWTWGEQDGGAGNIGSVYKLTNGGQVYVRWPTGRKDSYRFGMDGKFDLTVCDPFDPSVKRKVAEQNLSSGATASVSGKTSTKPSLSASSSIPAKIPPMQVHVVKDTPTEMKELTTKPKDSYSSSELVQGPESVSIYDLAPPATIVSTHEETNISHNKKHLKRRVKFEESPKEVDKTGHGTHDNNSETPKSIGHVDSERNNKSQDEVRENINKSNNDHKSKVAECAEEGKENLSQSKATLHSDFLPKQDLKTGKDDDTSDCQSVVSEVSSSMSPSGISQAQWQWRDSSGLWVSYPEATNQKIEKVFLKNPKSTAFINLGETYYRVVISKGIQINTSTHGENDVRRLEPLNDVANLKDVDCTTDQ